MKEQATGRGVVTPASETWFGGGGGGHSPGLVRGQLGSSRRERGEIMGEGRRRGGELCMFESREGEEPPIHWTRGPSAQRQTRSVKSIPQRQRGVPPSHPQLTLPIPSMRRKKGKRKSNRRPASRPLLAEIQSGPRTPPRSRKYNV